VQSHVEYHSMAYQTSIQPIEGLEDFDPSTFYNVGASVGSGGYNIRGDVMLVQFMLQQLGFEGGWAAGLKAIDTDGYYGPITASWIKRFQEYIQTYVTTAIFVDYNVDPSSNTGVSSISETIYTIVYLNGALHDYDADLFLTLPRNQLTPQYLRFELGGGSEPPPSPNPLPPPPPPPIQ
jgi:hypothetical protein